MRTYSIEEFLRTSNFRGASFSADSSKILVSSDASGIFNAYSIPSGGGDPVPLTHSADDSIFAVSYFPGDDRFLYESDHGGNELSHLYVQDPDGAVTDLTPGKGAEGQLPRLGTGRQDVLCRHQRKGRKRPVDHTC